MGRRSCELEPGLSTTLQPLLSQCKLEGTSLFGGQCKSCDIVITQFGLYVTLASRPGARPGGFGAALTARPFPTSSTVDGNNSFGLMLISYHLVRQVCLSSCSGNYTDVTLYRCGLDLLACL